MKNLIDQLIYVEDVMNSLGRDPREYEYLPTTMLPSYELDGNLVCLKKDAEIYKQYQIKKDTTLKDSSEGYSNVFREENKELTFLDKYISTVDVSLITGLTGREIGLISAKKLPRTEILGKMYYELQDVKKYWETPDIFDAAINEILQLRQEGCVKIHDVDVQKDRMQMKKYYDLAHLIPRNYQSAETIAKKRSFKLQRLKALLTKYEDECPKIELKSPDGAKVAAFYSKEYVKTTCDTRYDRKTNRNGGVAGRSNIVGYRKWLATKLKKTPRYLMNWRKPNSIKSL